MIRRLSLRARLLALPLALALSACAQVTNPATGEREFTTLTPAQEKQIGQQEHPKILQQFGGAYPDPALQQYVSEVGERMKNASELADQEFTFTLLDSEVVNAFALPGGYVYVTRGLLALAENEAELAGVLGHEIGHVTGRHTAQRQTQATGAGLGALGATILGAVLAGEAGAQLGQQLGGVGGQAYLASYSRDQELEADTFGIRYLKRAGYDPDAMATFLQKLNEQSALERQLAGVEGDPAENWFATHPRTLDRVEAALRSEGGAADGELDREAYLDEIDGMIYGQDPSQGFVRGSQFVHPDLRVAFQAPSSYQLQNTPSAVIGQGREGAFQFTLKRVPAGTDLRRYVARDWARELGASGFENVRAFEVNGMPAAAAATQGRTQRGPVIVRLAAIQADDSNVYRFMFIGQGDAGPAFEQTVSSFRRLSADEAAAVRPRRIQVVPVEPGTSTNSLAQRMAFDQAPGERFELLNQLALQQGLVAGERVKLVVE